MLADLIADHRRTQKAWQDKTDVDDTDAGSAAEWDAYQSAEAALIAYPCRSLEDVRIKVSFVLANDDALDTVQNCFQIVDGKQVDCVIPFLRSLLGEASS